MEEYGCGGLIMSELKTINKFCDSEKLDYFYRYYLYHKFNSDLEEQIANHKKISKSEPSEETISTIKSTLISNSTLSTNVKLAVEQRKRILDKEIKQYRLRQNIKVFSLNVLSGVLASILFTLLIVVVFTLGENQIKSWLNDFNSNTEVQIDNKNQEK